LWPGMSADASSNASKTTPANTTMRRRFKADGNLRRLSERRVNGI
jgi:hypothetical protein